MASNSNSSWEKIQLGVKDTERLIGQKDYNSAMVKARQTLEFMVKQLGERACIVDGSDLKDMIDTLYQNRWISKTTCEHYHKIRMIGNKAVHEGDNNAYNANQAYHMLSQEVYTFANDYSNAQKGTKRPGKSAASKGGASRSTASQNSRSRKRQSSKRSGFTAYDLLKLLVPLLCIVLLVCVIKIVKPASEEPKPTDNAVTTEAPSEETPTEPETMEVPAVYKTTSNLNVRSGPSTDHEKIGQLTAGTTVEYVGEHDSEWAIIMYNGQQAYVSSQYLTTE